LKDHHDFSKGEHPECSPDQSHHKSGSDQEASVMRAEKNELVQDPVCGAYCPKREAKSLVYRGKKYYFCSMECLKEFQEKKK